MSDHAWALEQLAAYVAGGLDAAERQRLEDHIRDCGECSAAMNDLRLLDRNLDSLFAPVRPGPALEDCMIRSLHTITAADLRRRVWKRQLLWGAAATVAVGLAGAGVSVLDDRGVLLFPGTDPSREFQSSVVLNGLPGDDSNLRSLQQSPGGWSKRSSRERGVLSPQEMSDHLTAGGFGSGGKDAPTTSNFAFSVDGQHKVTPAEVDHNTKLWSMYARERSGQVAQNNFDPETLKQALESAIVGQQAEQNKPPQDARGFKVMDPAKPAANPPAAEQAPQRKIIRTGEIEFEIESFDAAVAGIIKLVGAIKGGYVATVNSEKLANGKVRGAVVVRVPPESLDSLVLDLRRELGRGGELKGQRIGSEDITKKYTDLESRLKAARTMEQRLLQIIKEGKGEIKQLLEAEKELGVWRTKIEEMEGELRYYANQVALSTLTITLAEKEIRTAAKLMENERVQAGVEVEDVEKAQQQLLAAVAEAKGRVTRSELKQHGAGQYNAQVNFEVAPEQAGPLRDRLRQLGLVARLEIDRTQQAVGGTAPKDGPVTRGDTLFLVQLYNPAQMAPRETATLTIAATDVATAFRTLQDAIAKAQARVLKADLNEQDRQNVRGELDFEVRRSEEPALRATLAAVGDTTVRHVTRSAEATNTTDAKVRISATLVSAAQLPPRETTELTIEVTDVDQTAAVLISQASEAKGRVVHHAVNREADGRMTSHLVFDVPRDAAPTLVMQFRSAGAVRVQQTNRDPQAHDGPLAKARIEVTLSNSELIVPADDGLWPQVRRGLAWGLRLLLLSLSWLIVGLCVLLPWGVLGYVGYRLTRRLLRSTPSA